MNPDHLANPVSPATPEMTVADVVEICQLFSLNHIDFTVDGGWAVDALLGKQTRPHTDPELRRPHGEERCRALVVHT